MADDSSNDPAQSSDQWEELLDLLPVSTPEEIIAHIRALQRVRGLVGADTPDDIVEAVSALQERAETLEEQQAALQDAGFDMPEYAVDAIESMEQQLDELYNEKKVTEKTEQDAEIREDGDTFDQLQALLAREDKLRRQLGISNPDDIIEMVEGLTTQLEDLYEDREEDFNFDSIFSETSSSSLTSPAEPDRLSVLEDRIGVSDPDAIIAMMDDLSEQLEELYSGRQRLTEFNLNGAEEAIKMVQNMQEQLEALYEEREQMSEHGIENIDHALSMIGSMEAQLNELQDDPTHTASENRLLDLEDEENHLDVLQQKLSSLTEEKERLRRKRDRLQERLDALADEIGTQDPSEIADLVRSMENQLDDVYKEREHGNMPSSPTEATSLLDDETLSRLHEMDQEALDNLSVGVFGLDADGLVRNANVAALQWPDVTADSPDALLDVPFFEDIAPAAQNNLFQGRLEQKEENGLLNEPFLYAYVGKQSPLTNLAVHLYSAPDQSTDWVVFQVQEQYY